MKFELARRRRAAQGFQKVGQGVFESKFLLILGSVFHLQAHPFSTEPAGAGLGVVKVFYLTTRH